MIYALPTPNVAGSLDIFTWRFGTHNFAFPRKLTFANNRLTLTRGVITGVSPKPTGIPSARFIQAILENGNVRAVSDFNWNSRYQTRVHGRFRLLLIAKGTRSGALLSFQTLEGSIALSAQQGGDRQVAGYTGQSLSFTARVPNTAEGDAFSDFVQQEGVYVVLEDTLLSGKLWTAPAQTSRFLNQQIDTAIFLGELTNLTGGENVVGQDANSRHIALQATTFTPRLQKTLFQPTRTFFTMLDLTNAISAALDKYDLLTFFNFPLRNARAKDGDTAAVFFSLAFTTPSTPESLFKTITDVCESIGMRFFFCGNAIVFDYAEDFSKTWAVYWHDRQITLDEQLFSNSYLSSSGRALKLQNSFSYLPPFGIIKRDTRHPLRRIFQSTLEESSAGVLITNLATLQALAPLTTTPFGTAFFLSLSGPQILIQRNSGTPGDTNRDIVLLNQALGVLANVEFRVEIKLANGGKLTSGVRADAVQLFRFRLICTTGAVVEPKEFSEFAVETETKTFSFGPFSATPQTRLQIILRENPPPLNNASFWLLPMAADQAARVPNLPSLTFYSALRTRTTSTFWLIKRCQ